MGQSCYAPSTLPLIPCLRLYAGLHAIRAMSPSLRTCLPSTSLSCRTTRPTRSRAPTSALRPTLPTHTAHVLRCAILRLAHSPQARLASRKSRLRSWKRGHAPGVSARWHIVTPYALPPYSHTMPCTTASTTCNVTFAPLHCARSSATPGTRLPHPSPGLPWSRYPSRSHLVVPEWPMPSARVYPGR